MESNPCVTTKAVQENATEIHKRKDTRRSLNDLESESTERNTDENGITTLQYNHPDSREKQIRRPKLDEKVKDMTEINWQ